jgi:predicted GNAT superfamily acetyltransferase
MADPGATRSLRDPAARFDGVTALPGARGWMPAMTASDPQWGDPTASARALAAAAADAAGIAVRPAHDLAGCVAVRRLADTVWSSDPTNPSVTAELLRAYGHTGQYVVVAHDLTRPGRPIVAASVAWLSAPAGLALHSHLTGVLPEGRGRSLGFALKAHQRAWALERGLQEITWTFDPLIRRNAWFNLAKLGCRALDYFVDFYGSMADAVNAGDSSDRLFVSWRLGAAQVVATLADGPRVIDVDAERAAGAVEVLVVDGGVPVLTWPAPAGVRTALAQVPPDVETLRRADPGVGRAWREALRVVLVGALGTGWRVRGVDRGGWYVLDAPGAGEDAR